MLWSLLSCKNLSLAEHFETLEATLWLKSNFKTTKDLTQVECSSGYLSIMLLCVELCRKTWKTVEIFVVAAQYYCTIVTPSNTVQIYR